MRYLTLLPLFFGLASVAIFLGCVELLLTFGLLNQFVIPFPSAVLGSFGRLFAEEQLFHRLVLTGTEALAASVLVSLFGISIGVLLHRCRVLQLATEPWIAAITAAPIVLAYPLFLVMFGRSAVTIVAMGFFAGLAPVILKTLEGLNGVRKSFINVGHSYKLTPAQLFWKIELPAAVPTIFVGVRLGLVFALINLIGVEFLINFGGLGQLVNDLAERYDLPGVFATIVFVILVSVVIFSALERMERWFRPADRS
ncbi:ABC transporter permease [Ancylobacter polymorphus]|uniref:NitT/TauT family transport system permease protein n=1 Tax=Ancylobacter polymorphus TaxID=223390 RepID=A0ABU0BK57_9HYPH|nr:ABC transporter permease subunit [Ancylobacter polymorphus]MDQ0304854.1 NitT/TauT family transport system permease protein [Ancylobacter polymorphus]